MNIAVFVTFVIYSYLILAASTASIIGVFFPSPNNAPLPFCSPVKEHLGGWGWTGASVNTDEVTHNLDYRHTLTQKSPQGGIPDHGMAFSPPDLELPK